MPKGLGKCTKCGEPFGEPDERVEARREIAESCLAVMAGPPPEGDHVDAAAFVTEHLEPWLQKFLDAFAQASAEPHSDGIDELDSSLRDLRWMEAAASRSGAERDAWSPVWREVDGILRGLHRYADHCMDAFIASTPEAAEHSGSQAKQQLDELTPNTARLAEAIEKVRSGLIERAIATPEDGEALARDWMRLSGFPDARLTSGGADRGIDVTSTRAVAQVKAHRQPVGRPDIQRLSGIANHEGKDALFFSLSGYTGQARQWSKATGVALFQFDLQGRVQAVNKSAAGLTRRGAIEAPPATTGLLEALRGCLTGAVPVFVLLVVARISLSRSRRQPPDRRSISG